MGGTGVALGQDGSVPFLNPAAMSRIADTRLAFSVKLFRWTRAYYENLAAQPPTWDDQLPEIKTTRNRLRGIPSTFCAFVTLAGLLPAQNEGLLAALHGSSARRAATAGDTHFSRRCGSLCELALRAGFATERPARRLPSSHRGGVGACGARRRPAAGAKVQLPRARRR